MHWFDVRCLQQPTCSWTHGRVWQCTLSKSQLQAVHILHANGRAPAASHDQSLQRWELGSTSRVVCCNASLANHIRSYELYLRQKHPKYMMSSLLGTFVVKRTNRRFNQVPADQATEWMNKTCKVQNGIIDITRNDQARDKFCVTWPERSRILQGTRCLFSLEDDEEAITLFCPLGQPFVTKETRYWWREEACHILWKWWTSWSTSCRQSHCHWPSLEVLCTQLQKRSCATSWSLDLAHHQKFRSWPEDVCPDWWPCTHSSTWKTWWMPDIWRLCWSVHANCDISHRVDVVFDRYIGDASIKAVTRSKSTCKKKPIRKVIDGPHVPLPQVWSQFTVLDDNKASLAQFISEVIMEEEKGKDLPERFDLVTGVDSQMLRIQDQRGEMMSVFKQTIKRLTPGWYSIHVRLLTKVTKECRSSAETQMFCFFWFISCKQKQLKCGWSLEQQRCGNVTQYMVYLRDWPGLWWILDNLRSFHALAGSDSTSSFSGHEKKKC